MDHSKVTVPQLKALCKEKGLTGYSKLNRQALLDKLSNNAQTTSSATPAEKPSSSVITSNAPASSTSDSSPSLGSTPAGFSSGIADNAAPPTSIVPTLDARIKSTTGGPESSNQSHMLSASQKSTPRPERPSFPSHTDPNNEMAKTQCTSKSVVDVPPSKTPPLPGNTVKTKAIAPRSDRPCPHTAAPPTVSKENVFKVPPVPFTTSSPAASQKTVPKAVSSKRTHASAFSVAPARPSPRPSAPALASSSSSSQAGKRTPDLHPSAGATNQSNELPGKRFKPLTIARPVVQPTPPQLAQTRLATEPLIQAQPATAHLDFPPPSDLPSLSNITLPPSLSQRKIVCRWAIILSGLSNGERRACARVSRMFRYAVHLSASEILSRECAGSRREHARTLYPAPTINWWPYLREREREKIERLRAYGSSFLANFYGSCPISERLLGSPDNPKQLTIAFRFLQTRLWFTLSIGTLANAGSDPLAWLRSTVVNAQEVAPNEIWQITTSTGESFYVLEATCEVIGHPPGCNSVAPALRADWMDYTTAQGNGKPLLQRMRWAHNEEYERGLSRHWLARTKQMGEPGAALRAVGERYTLACVVSNGVSGAWMSTAEMAQGLSGTIQPIQTTKNSTKRSLGLFLPAHHHVESVHFAATGGQPLHPALAIIQTTAREYFILRDNGMQVGCEEDGVVEMWRKVLSCDASGRAVRGGELLSLATMSNAVR